MEDLPKDLQVVDIYEIGPGDFIIPGGSDEIVKLSSVEKVKNSRGKIMDWTVTGEDGRQYGMRDVSTYVKTCSVKKLVSRIRPNDVIELTLRNGSKVVGHYKEAERYIGCVTHIILSSGKFASENIVSYEVLKKTK